MQHSNVGIGAQTTSRGWPHSALLLFVCCSRKLPTEFNDELLGRSPSYHANIDILLTLNPHHSQRPGISHPLASTAFLVYQITYDDGVGWTDIQTGSSSRSGGGSDAGQGGQTQPGKIAKNTSPGLEFTFLSGRLTRNTLDRLGLVKAGSESSVFRSATVSRSLETRCSA
jgi:hypothetical protein